MKQEKLAKQNMFDYFKWFFRYWGKSKGKMTGVFILTVVSIAAKTAFPILLKYIIDMLSKDVINIGETYHLIYLFFLGAVFHQLVSRALPMTRAFMNMTFAIWVRDGYFGKWAKKTPMFFRKFRTGDLLTRLTDDIDGGWDRMAWYSCSGLMRPVEYSLVLAFTLGVMMYYSVGLTLWSFIPIPFLVFIMAKTEDKMVAYTDAKQKSISECNNTLEACFSGIRVVKTTNSEKDQIKKYESVITERVKREKNFLKINELIHFFAMLANQAGSIIVIFIGSYYVIQNKITLGTFVLFLMYLQRLIEPIWTLSWFYASSKQVFRYVDRLQQTEPYGNQSTHSAEYDNIDEVDTLEFNNVAFKFEDANENVLHDLSFKLNKGEKIAIVGPVGSGKTTLLEMIAGNLDPSSGEITVNNISLDKYSRKAIAESIGYVRQENVLFSESIHDNLLLGHQYNKQEIAIALDIALMTDEIKGFPNGVDTVLGQKGVSLSGGQKQRVSIARTLIRKPKLILFDDCTAAMDAETEQKFWVNLENYLGKENAVTSVIVTHRLATAKYADRIIVIENGKIYAIGTHEELSSNSSHYMKIMASQDETMKQKHDIITNCLDIEPDPTF